MTNATTCFFHLALLFLVSVFIMKRYDDIHLIFAQYTYPIKYFLLRKWQEKSQSISSQHGVLKMAFKLVRKTLFEKA